MKKLYYQIYKPFFLFTAIIFAFFPGSNSFAAARNIVGNWQTFNEEGKKTSVIQIWQEGDEFRGKIIKLFNTAKPPKEVVCANCEGDFKDKPLLGMTTVWGLHQDGDKWENGKILLPKQGKVFNCDITMSSDGQQLNVRVFKSLVGKTRTWTRENN